MSDTKTVRQHALYLNQEMRLIIRALIIERDGEKCHECESKERLEFHHVRYREWPTIDDLILLCHECHINETMKARGHKRRKGMTKAQIRKAQRIEAKQKA